MHGQRAAFDGEACLPALCRLSLRGRAPLAHDDAAALQRQSQRRPFQDLCYPFLEHEDRSLGHVEIDVLRVPDALEKEAQIAAALDREPVFVRRRAEEPDEVKVEQLDRLAFIHSFTLHDFYTNVDITYYH